MNAYQVMRNIGKAWAKAPARVRPLSYIKEGRAQATGPVQPCRGARRAIERRHRRSLVKLAARGLR